MAQPEFMTRAEGDFASTSAGTRPVLEESTATMERSSLSSASEKPSCSGAGASVGCASFIGVLLRLIGVLLWPIGVLLRLIGVLLWLIGVLLRRVPPRLRDSTHSSSEYFSSRIQKIIESKSKFETALDAEIESSKGHWSELPPGSGAQGCAEADMELFRRLKQQYASPDGSNSFFVDWAEDEWELGEKIAEGAQGAIHELRWLLPEGAYWNGKLVVKVFKLEGWSLEALHEQWPPAMLHKILITSPYLGLYGSDGISGIVKGLMLKDGRFGFLMRRYWGDLRTMIDLRMVHNGNQAPPFSDEIALRIMHGIAKGMLQLHKDGIHHRDLKAANVLIFPEFSGDYEKMYKQFDPIIDDKMGIYVADFECSAATYGTGFWRAPEILLGLKTHQVEPTLFTEKSDVYSYGMTCYEILTGKIPFEDVPTWKYDEVIVHGREPLLPSDIRRWVQSILKRCWHHDPSRRPSFEEIVEKFEDLNKSYMKNVMENFVDCFLG